MNADRDSGSRTLAPSVLIPLIILFCGCASAPNLSLAPTIAGPRHLIRHILAHTDSLHNARVRSRVSLEIEGVRQKATSVVFFDRPSDLKMEVNGTLGVNIMSAKFWGDSLRVYLPGDNGYLDGRAAGVLYQVTGMNLAYYDIQNIILGIPTLSVKDADHVTGFQTTADHYILDMHLGPVRRRLWVDRVRVAVTREDIFDTHGAVLSQLRLSGYETHPGCLLAGNIQIDQGANHITWSVESVRTNAGVDRSVFDLTMPTSVVRLDD